MNQDIKNWLVMGIPKNWETTFSQPVPIWGLRARYNKEFEKLKIGDILWFYATSPVSGIIGLGSVKDKYVDEINLFWPEELNKKQIIWPFRFRIHVLKLLPPSFWEKNKIKIKDFHIFGNADFNNLAMNT